MSRYIDADALELPYGYCEDAAECYKALYALPSIDIVRCKDCRWFGEIGCAIRIVDDSDKPKEDDFCSFAERK